MKEEGNNKKRFDDIEENIDFDAYAPYLDDMQLTDQQKREFLITLYSIMRSFVELGFSVDLCAQLLELPNEHMDDSSIDVKSKKSSEKVASTNGSTKETLR